MPKYHVIKFQQIAPIKPARITMGVTFFISINPLPTVLATVVPNIKKAIKLKNAAQATAARGDKTLVDTMVAMEFAASCIPLVKSKIKATIIMNTINMKNISGMLDHYAFYYICRIFAFISYCL